MATEKPRFSITVTDEIYKALEDYRHEAGLSSRSQAALAMIRKGFELVGKEQGIDSGPKGRRFESCHLDHPDPLNRQ